MSIKLKPLQFKDYVWPHNPRTFEMQFQKNIVEHEYPDLYGSESEDLGLTTRIIRGTGEFYGENAYKDFSALTLMYYDSTPGLLIHPMWIPFQARFTKLSSREEPRPNYVAYEFEFIEYRELNDIVKVGSKPSSGEQTPTTPPPASSPSQYTVKKGDTLWDIAKRKYGKGTEWPKIAEANKELIKNPNLIYPGWKLTIP